MLREFNNIWERVIDRIDGVRRNLGWVNWEEEMYLQARPGDVVRMRVHYQEGLKSRDAIVGGDKLLDDPERTAMLDEFGKIKPGTKVEFFLLRRKKKVTEGFDIIASHGSPRNDIP